MKGDDMHNFIISCNNLLKSGGFQYAFCGGFALDIHIGQITRLHGDIDVSAFTEDRNKVITFMRSQEWSAYEGSGNGTVHLIENINDQMLINPNVFFVKNNCDIFHIEYIDNNIYKCDIDKIDKFDFIEFLFDKRNDTEFIYPRNNKISRKLEKAVLYKNNIPYLSPELVLLYKSTDLKRNENKQDFNIVVPYLSDDSKEWLYYSLITAFPKGHEWILSLENL